MTLIDRGARLEKKRLSHAVISSPLERGTESVKRVLSLGLTGAGMEAVRPKRRISLQKRAETRFILDPCSDLLPLPSSAFAGQGDMSQGEGGSSEASAKR